MMMLVSVLYGCLFLYWIGTIFWDIYGWHNQQRIMQVALLFLILMSQILFSLHKDKERNTDRLLFSRETRITLLFFGLALCGAVSVTGANDSHWAMLEWALLLSICAGMFMVARFRKVEGAQFDRIVLFVIGSVCTIYLFGFLGRYASLFSGMPLRIWDMFLGFSNLRFFGQFQTMTLPLLAVIAMAASSVLQRWGGFALLSSWWMLSIASGTRGTWLAIVAAMAVVWLMGRSVGRRWVRWQIAGIAAGLGLYGLMFFAVPALLDSQLQLINRLPSLTSLSLRDVLWAEAWRMICTHPWFGVGPMHFAAVPNGIGAHPHNAVLQIAAEWGVPVLLMLSTLVVMGFHRLVKHLRVQSNEASFDNVLGVALFASLTAAGVQSLVDGVIVMPYSQVTLMVLAGWAIGICSSAARAEQQGAPAFLARWKEIAFLGFSTLLLGIVIVLALPDVPHLQERMQRYTDKYHTTYFNPRFWQQGWINE